MEKLRYNFTTFKQLDNFSCVYGIYCIPAKKWYIGQTTQFKTRLKGHLVRLNNGKHCNVHLLRCYKKYSAEAFEIKILRRCAPSELNRQEQYFIDLYRTTNPTKGFNIHYFDKAGNSTYKPEFSDTVRNSRSRSFKLTKNDVKVIRELYSLGYTHSTIRSKFNINPTHLSGILGNRVWPDREYTKPTAVPSLNPEQIILVSGLISSNHSINEIVLKTGINWRRIKNTFGVGEVIKTFKPRSSYAKACSAPLILDMVTGVYLESYKEAARYSGTTAKTIKSWLTTRPDLNKTNLIIT